MISETAKLEGYLTFIHSILDASDNRDEKDKKDAKTITSFRALFKRFLFFKNFVANARPIVVCEGKTDNVFVSLAIRHLAKFHPKLAEFKDGKIENKVSFYKQQNHKNRQSLSSRLLEISEGAGNLKYLIIRYAETLQKFKSKMPDNPTIILIDNDDGATDIFSSIKTKYKIDITHKSNSLFHHLTDNLYLIKTPSDATGKHTAIEDCFDPAVLTVELDGKKFSPKNKIDPKTEYSKHVLAEKVVKPQADKIVWTGFERLAEAISAVIDDYALERFPDWLNR